MRKVYVGVSGVLSWGEGEVVVRIRRGGVDVHLGVRLVLCEKWEVGSRWLYSGHPIRFAFHPPICLSGLVPRQKDAAVGQTRL